MPSVLIVDDEEQIVEMLQEMWDTGLLFNNESTFFCEQPFSF